MVINLMMAGSIYSLYKGILVWSLLTFFSGGPVSFCSGEPEPQFPQHWCATVGFWLTPLLVRAERSSLSIRTELVWKWWRASTCVDLSIGTETIFKESMRSVFCCNFCFICSFLFRGIWGGLLLQPATRGWGGGVTSALTYQGLQCFIWCLPHVMSENRCFLDIVR